MRLGRFNVVGQDRIGVFENSEVRGVTNEFDSFRDALSRPADAATATGETFDRSRIEYLPLTTDRNTIFCAGLNYEAHAE